MKSFFVEFAVLGMLVALPTSWAQQKYTIADAPQSKSQYVKEHIIDVGDRPGHQLRVYEIRIEYPANDLFDSPTFGMTSFNKESTGAAGDSVGPADTSFWVSCTAALEPCHSIANAAANGTKNLRFAIRPPSNRAKS